MIAQSNGVVTRIGGGGFTEEPGSDRDAGADAEKWAGSAPCYYRERQERRRGAEGRDVIVRRILIVGTRDVPAAELATDDSIDFTVDGVARTAKIQNVEISIAPRGPSPVETTRVELAPG